MMPGDARVLPVVWDFVDPGSESPPLQYAQIPPTRRPTANAAGDFRKLNGAPRRLGIFHLKRYRCATPRGRGGAPHVYTAVERPPLE